MVLQKGNSAPIPVEIFVVGTTSNLMMATQNTVATVPAEQTPPTLWQNRQGSTGSLSVDDQSETDADKLLEDCNDNETETEADGLASVATSAYQSQGTTNYVAEMYPFKDRLAHFTPGNILQPQFARAVQAACIFEAGHRVLEMGTQKEPDLKDCYVDSYNEVLEEIDDSYMDDIAKQRLKVLVGARADNATTPMDGAKIQKKYNEFKRFINKFFIPVLPKNISALKSGTDLNEAWDKMRNHLIAENWKNAKKPPPDHYMLTGPSPVFLFLTVQIFRTSAVINPHVANVTDNRKSKAEICLPSIIVSSEYW